MLNFIFLISFVLKLQLMILSLCSYYFICWFIFINTLLRFLFFLCVCDLKKKLIMSPPSFLISSHPLVVKLNKLKDTDTVLASLLAEQVSLFICVVRLSTHAILSESHVKYTHLFNMCPLRYLDSALVVCWCLIAPTV